jgi:putative ABC transport system permease protein
VVEFAIQAKARQQARKAIKTAVRGEITDIMNTRKELRGQLQQFSSLFALVMVISASLLLFFLYAHNVKERRHEIAILRTVGVRVSKIFGLFIAKALVLALMGSSLGYVGAMLLGAKLSASIQPVWSLAFFGLLFGAAALVSVVASLLPTVVAARRDPSLVLNEED